MKVAFVVPKDDGHINPLNGLAQCRLFPPVGLARMAGQVKKHGRSELVDERVGKGKHINDADIAVVFINSYNRNRSYELAKRYNSRGTYVIFTGPVLTQSAEDACEHADCLFIGDGDAILPDFLNDYAAGKLRRLYAPSLLETMKRPAAFATSTGQVLSIASA